MFRPRGARHAAVSLAAIAIVSASGGAQGQIVQVRAGKPNWSASGTTVTAGFVVANPRPRPLQIIQRIDLPPDWFVLTGNAPVLVGAGQSGLVMVGVGVPARAGAGRYVVIVNVFDAANERLLGKDSVRIVVPRRRALDVGLLDRPNFVISGKNYEAGFVVRNRGNMASPIRPQARSSLRAPS